MFSRDLSTYLKGLAIILVIINHIGECYGFPGPLGAIGVTIFLLLSGYGLNESLKVKNGVKGYWNNKFISIYIPYICLSVPILICSEELTVKKGFFLMYLSLIHTIVMVGILTVF